MRVPYYLCVFVAAALAIGAAWWAMTDESGWWAGYEDPDRGFVPKFKFHWYEQAVVAAIVGLAAAVPVTAGTYLTHRVCGRLRRPAG